MKLKHKFVKSAPNDLEEGVLYISMRFNVIIHLCCCGCQNKVVTPLSPARWRMTYDGETVSLYPSIGNWNFDCESHYWITESEVKWAETWSEEEIKQGKKNEREKRARYYSQQNSVLSNNKSLNNQAESLISRLFSWFKKD